MRPWSGLELLLRVRREATGELHWLHLSAVLRRYLQGAKGGAEIPYVRLF